MRQCLNSRTRHVGTSQSTDGTASESHTLQLNPCCQLVSSPFVAMNNPKFRARIHGALNDGFISSEDISELHGHGSSASVNTVPPAGSVSRIFLIEEADGDDHQKHQEIYRPPCKVCCCGHGEYYTLSKSYFLERYSGHGIRHWFLSGSIYRRFFWVAVIAACLHFTILQSAAVIQEYLTYPKSVAVSVVDEEVVDFPAVTVCNFNMMSKSRLMYQMKKNRTALPERLQQVLHLEQRIERMLTHDGVADPDYSSLCTKGYMRWQTPSAKVAPVKQVWPFSEEESNWEEILREIRSERVEKLKAAHPPPNSKKKNAKKIKELSWMLGKNPCQLMAKFHVAEGFNFTALNGSERVIEWEVDTGLNFTEEYHLPQPNEVFKCKNGTLLSFNDGLLSDVCGKAFYDPASNRPCLGSYFGSQGVPFKLDCFPLNRICDRSQDCGHYDDTDESLYCDSLGDPMCSKAEHLNACNDGACYDKGLRCDGIEDCQDGSDEEFCSGPKYDKNCGCFVTCEIEKDGEEKCWEFSPYDGLDGKNFESFMMRSRTVDFPHVSSIMAPSQNDLKSYGVRGIDFIVSCSFDGVPCSYKDFYKWQNHAYGNCFTFNSPHLAEVAKDGRYEKTYKTSKYGYKYGLRLSLNIEAEDYLATVTPVKGAKLLIHHPNEIPFPAESGIDLSPFMEAVVAVKRTHIQRVPAPHGNCDPQNEGKWKEKYGANYTVTACNKLCRENAIRRTCNCSQVLNVAYGKVDETPRCIFSNKTQRRCIDDVLETFRTRSKNGTEKEPTEYCHCVPNCNEWVYEATTSGAMKNRQFQYTFSNINKVFLTEDFCAKTKQGEAGTVHAHVYLESLSHELIVETQAYTFERFIANVGGSWGLFAGFSIVTFVELFEFLFHTVLWAFRRIHLNATKLVRRGRAVRSLFKTNRETASAPAMTSASLSTPDGANSAPVVPIDVDTNGKNGHEHGGNEGCRRVVDMVSNLSEESGFKRMVDTKEI